MDLELEIRKKKTEFEVLEAKFKALEAEKLGIEEQFEALKIENAKLKECRCGGDNENNKDFGGTKKAERVVDLTEDGWDEDGVTQLMIENKILECEKEKAERDVKAWERKFKELESRLHQGFGMVGERRQFVENLIGNEEKVVELVDGGSICCSPAKGICTPKGAGSDSNYTPCKLGDCIKEEVKFDCLKPDTSSQRARRQLSFEKEKSPGKKMAPSTPAAARPSFLSIIDIYDSDEEPNNTRVQLPNHDGGKTASVASKKVMTTEVSLKHTNSQEENVEDIDACKENIPLVSTLKRKRASNIVMSDSESDGDDNIPISRLKKMNLEEIGPKQNESSENATASAVGNGNGSANHPTRRLAPIRKCRGKGTAERKSPSDTTETKYRQGIPTNVSTDEDDDSDEVASESEGESLGGFIVNDSDVSRGDDSPEDSENSADGNIEFSEILSNLRRKKERNFKWDFEADMLADFGKDTELCMKAVCTLYRQQTSEEKISKGTLYSNCRGFSKFDALRGTNLAEFLTAGDRRGDLQKSVQELEEHDPKAVKLCRSLATHYSKQLFAIYKNKEDPLFLP